MVVASFAQHTSRQPGGVTHCLLTDVNNCSIVARRRGEQSGAARRRGQMASMKVLRTGAKVLAGAGLLAGVVPEPAAAVDVAQLLGRMGLSTSTSTEATMASKKKEKITCEKWAEGIDSDKDEACSKEAKDVGGNSKATFAKSCVSVEITEDDHLTSAEKKKQRKRAVYTCCSDSGIDSFVSCC
ncbi:unnamed protein product [Amoebophrya sp. A120]|nr:unnamed protein product [Amoebophrya sp. A120]|eukprot:GSA120T00015618001.1